MRRSEIARNIEDMMSVPTSGYASNCEIAEMIADDVVTLYEPLRKSAVLLLQHAEHGIGSDTPQWLAECRRVIEAAASLPPHKD